MLRELALRSSSASWRSRASGRSLFRSIRQFKQDELDFYFRNSGVRAVIADEPGIAVSERIAERWDDGVRLITTASRDDGPAHSTG